MRARVFFQFCTVSALLGGVYIRAQSGEFSECSRPPCASPPTCAHMHGQRARSLSLPPFLLSPHLASPPPLSPARCATPPRGRAAAPAGCQAGGCAGSGGEQRGRSRASLCSEMNAAP
jgi:hypothetical protein